MQKVYRSKNHESTTREKIQFQFYWNLWIPVANVSKNHHIKNLSICSLSVWVWLAYVKCAGFSLKKVCVCFYKFLSPEVRIGYTCIYMGLWIGYIWYVCYSSCVVWRGHFIVRSRIEVSLPFFCVCVHNRPSVYCVLHVHVAVLIGFFLHFSAVLFWSVKAVSFFTTGFEKGDKRSTWLVDNLFPGTPHVSCIGSPLGVHTGGADSLWSLRSVGRSL